MKRVILIFGLSAASIFMTAQDTISFVWKGEVNKQITIAATNGEQFLVKWGDATPDITMIGWGVSAGRYPSHSYIDSNNYTVSVIGTSINCLLTCLVCKYSWVNSINLSKSINLLELDCSGNQLSNLDLSKNTAMLDLRCSNNQLTTLDLSKNTALRYVYCSYNQLSSLDLSKKDTLEYLECQGNNLNSLIVSPRANIRRAYCYDNKLLLSDLHAASEKIFGVNGRRLGTQRLDTRQMIVGDTIDFSSQTAFKYFGNTAYTKFDVFKRGISDSIPAIENIDYTLNNGIIVFNAANDYFVIMTNSAIISEPGYEAIVIASFSVRDKSTDVSLSNLAVSKGKLTPAFHTDTLNYFVEVEYSVTDINITATARDSLATISGNLGLQPLDTGNNVFTINVIAEDGITTQNYTIIVNRKDTVIENNIIEIAGEEFKLYPNPTNSKVYIQKESNIKVYTIQGILLQEAFGKEIDLSTYPQGLYLIQVNEITKKIIKK